MKAYVSADFAYVGNKVGNDQDFVWVYLGSPLGKAPYLQFYPMILRGGHWSSGRWVQPTSIAPFWSDVSVNGPRVENVIVTSPSLKLSKYWGETGQFEDVFLADYFMADTGALYDASATHKGKSVFVSQIVSAAGFTPLPILNAFGTTGSR